MNGSGGIKIKVLQNLLIEIVSIYSSTCTKYQIFFLSKKIIVPGGEKSSESSKELESAGRQIFQHSKSNW